MIAYFDTSAVVPMLLPEPGSAAADRCWTGADRVLSARIMYPEARAALAAAKRMRRLTASALAQAVAGLEQLHNGIHIVEIDEPVARLAGELAHAHGLRGYDAVHLASAESIAPNGGALFVSGDARLLDAASRIGFDVVSTLGPAGP